MRGTYEVEELGSDDLKSSEARVLIGNVSFVSDRWVINNATSIYELEVNREHI